MYPDYRITSNQGDTLIKRHPAYKRYFFTSV